MIPAADVPDVADRSNNDKAERRNENHVGAIISAAIHYEKCLATGITGGPNYI